MLEWLAAAMAFLTSFGGAAHAEQRNEGPGMPALADGTGVETPQLDLPIDLGGLDATQATTKAVIGTFKFIAGACEGGVRGSWFRLTQPGGSAANGPYVTNADSACTNKNYTLLTPGTDGGLVTGSYQPQPQPAFDAAGNALAARLMQPTAFNGFRLSLASNPTDPQSGLAVAAPSMTVDETNRLAGDIRALGMTWNGQDINQGAPKPDGGRPPGSTGPKGVLNPTNGSFILEWTSPIQGGTFNGFLGEWHMVGTFTADPNAQPEAGPRGPGGGGSTGGGGGGGGGGPAHPATGPASSPVWPLVAIAGWLAYRRRRGR